jgi:alcohol dehydrogenase class IV
MGVTADLLPRIAEHAVEDPAADTSPRPARREEYEDLLRASM